VACVTARRVAHLHKPCGLRGLRATATIQSLVTDLESAAMTTAVRMYTTQVCPYCIRAKALLKQRGVEAIDEVRIDLDPVQRDQMIALTGRRTVPQIFIGDTHVGGCDDLVALDRDGGLAPLLQGA
jgi:glutaredoxin 3